MTDYPTVHAHSVAEAYLYLKVTPCANCRRGMLRADGDLTRAQNDWQIACTCRQCHQKVTISFDIQPLPTRESAQTSVINPTSDASRAIDLPGWLNLFQQIATAAGREKDRSLGRELAIEAARCLDEALKFYDADNEMPPPTAFFSTAGRDALRDHPQRFARSIWKQRRLQLPQLREAPNLPVEKGERRKRRWWPFGRKDGG